MSLASYIGCNIELSINDDGSSGGFFYIGSCFAGERELQNVKKYQLTTPYVYEVSSHWGIEISEYMDQETCAESKVKLLELCNRMNNYLVKGDYFELYSCWIGEEKDKREGEIIFQINNFDIDQIEIPEKTLVRFEK
ncbi:hypothetical protein QNH36_01155 [Mesobacillus sp. AQ2]|uniref:hypothetical protein n=1 Tax=Bacillaceae TaxID=186817 RepID=UPI0011A1AE39|nr:MULTISPECIES: hypothetical protein [Bacillaceae]MCM3125684.1 hypothetical protein [Mesobacillus sp. MER 33]MCM3235705.1 hypothetical protein [Mesobacillus sp. MER 48]WHX40816.1 hypothetical protein QNH36_01155 [Mesobacillus sp. AQ2]